MGFFKKNFSNDIFSLQTQITIFIAIIFHFQWNSEKITDKTTDISTLFFKKKIIMVGSTMREHFRQK